MRAFWFTLWILVSALSFALLLKFEQEPSETELHPALWPAGSRIPGPAGKHTLLMFIHPKCPCSSASISELSKIISKTGSLDVKVAYLGFKNADRSWDKSRQLSRLAEIPRLRIFQDIDGAEAARFGACSSGETLVYDPSGRLVFAGGITGGRSHEGDNRGADLLLSSIAQGNSKPALSQVFGCSLNDCPSPNLEQLKQCLP